MAHIWTTSNIGEEVLRHPCEFRTLKLSDMPLIYGNVKGCYVC